MIKTLLALTFSPRRDELAKLIRLYYAERLMSFACFKLMPKGSPEQLVFAAFLHGYAQRIYGEGRTIPPGFIAPRPPDRTRAERRRVRFRRS